MAELLPEAQLTNWHRTKKVTSKYVYRRAGVAVSESPEGPFRFVHALLPNGEKSLDLQLWQEEGGESDGPAFLVRSVNNKFVGATRLSPDYLTTVNGMTTLVKPALEGMALFRNPADDALCAVMSHLTGWEPNPLVFLRSRRRGGGPCAAKCTLDDPGLGWERLGNPTGEHASFNMQPTYATTARDAQGNWLRDNWLRAGPHGLPDAGYAWLPMEFGRDGSAEIRRMANWSTAAPFD